MTEVKSHGDSLSPVKSQDLTSSVSTLWGGEKFSDYWGDAIAGALDLRPDYSRPPVTQIGGAMPPPRRPRVGNVAGGYEGDDRKNGETERTATGRERHKWYNFGEGFRPEVTLKNGDRVDAVNMQMRHIKELKPDNPAKAGEYQRQLLRYLEQLEREFPTRPGQKPWTGEIVH